MHYMALQALHGTSDNSSILASKCLECRELFVATDDLRAFRIKRPHGWIAERKNGYATLLQIE
jgi:hypothetical protein